METYTMVVDPSSTNTRYTTMLHYLLLNATTSNAIADSTASHSYTQIGGSSAAGFLYGTQAQVQLSSGGSYSFTNAFGGLFSGLQAKSSSASTWAGTATLITAVYALPLSIGTGPTGTVTQLTGVYVPTSITHSVVVTNYAAFYAQTNGFTPTTNNIGLQLPAFTGSTNNVGVWLASNVISATSGGGICAGPSVDICMWRGAAGVWNDNGARWINTYACIGCTSAPVNTATGVLTLQPIVNPTSQAFGAVTANGVTGLLTFTVATAASTCATAVVTNSKVASGSIVRIDIQGYSGTATDMISVRRLDTAGSSSGSFTIQLCNRNTSGSLSGSIYLAYEVRN
jgi:hypothetical protein